MNGLKRYGVLAGFVMLVLATPVWALDEAARREFDRYLNMGMGELTEAAAGLLARKYPDEQWESRDFPAFAQADRTIETSYRIAVMAPDLLGRANLADKAQVIPCYCTCRQFGHANLLHCFWKDGRPGGEFDDHGSQCGICMRQAFLAFLWDDLGASHAEIIEGMEQAFAPLIKRLQEAAGAGRD